MRRKKEMKKKVDFILFGMREREKKDKRKRCFLHSSLFGWVKREKKEIILFLKG